MKKITQWLGLIALAGLTAFAFLGCSAADGLYTFVTTAQRNLEAVNNLDDVAEEDMADSTDDTLDLSLHLAYTLAEESELTNAEKIALIRQLRTEIRTFHEAIVAQRAEVRIAFEDMKSGVIAFREAGFTLTEEQQTRLGELKTELRAITEEMKASIGQAYRKLADLRGHYTLENIDLVLSTHQEVSEVLAMRLENLNRIEEIFAEVLAMVTLPGE